MKSRDIDRLWNKIDIVGEDECWNWKEWKDRDGYGRLKLEGKNPRAHRVVYELVIGPIPKGLLIIHSCDNSSCCNPKHLRVGTNLDNMKDMVVRGRSMRGEINTKAKLTAFNIIEIRNSYIPKYGSLTKLAKKFGVTKQNILSIVRRETWKHIL